MKEEGDKGDGDGGDGMGGRSGVWGLVQIDWVGGYSLNVLSLDHEEFEASSQGRSFDISI